METKINSFLEYLVVERGYSKNTLSAYAIDLTQFLEHLQKELETPKTNWAEVAKEDIVSYILHLRGDRRYTASTVARKVAAIKSFFKFLAQEEVIPGNPTAGLDSPKVERRLPRAISQEEVKQLLAQTAAAAAEGSPKGLRDQALLQLAYATGMRASELISLNLDDLSLASGSVRCLGKGGKERVIPIHPLAVRTLSAYIDKARGQFLKERGERALFLNQRGQRLTRQGLWLILKGYVQRAGLTARVTPHTLRHSFATHLLGGDADLINVQQLLGHANVSTTQIYTQVTTDRLREVYNRSHPRAK
ncbi:MAG: site-specific tyrosine recombinase XerD [Chloroflexi bacterium]|nr:site-specific tyrosine recombinase XerD [Chloroflexota bacterium]